MLLFVDNLTNCDFSYLHPSRGLLGETWLASIELDGELDEQGMICDFGVVKATVRRWLDETIDHSLVVPGKAPQLQLLSKDGSNLRWEMAQGKTLVHRSPPQCVSVIDVAEVTPESVAAWSEEELRKLLPASIRELRLRFSTEVIDGPFYQYSHGLKKHRGKCQRIAHGHRSKIEIWRDGEAMPVLERRWSERLRDIYIASREDQLSASAPGHLSYCYRAQEGEFFLQVPEQQSYLIDTDSTVEFIALHIAETLKAEEPAHEFCVKAYEGLAKGAIVVR